jgi:hypothetical protein
MHGWTENAAVRKGRRWFRPNHKKDRNWKEKEAMRLISNHEYVFMAADCFNNNTWVADTGASTHMGNIVIGMRDVVAIDEPIFVGNDTTARATKKGTLDLMLIQTNGDTAKISLEDYKYSPEMGRCLFSIMKALQEGWKISNHNTTIKLKRGEAEICFDRITTTRDGMLCGVELVLLQGEMANLGSENGNKKSQSTKDDKKADTWQVSEFSWGRTNFHEIFGHASSSSMEATAAYNYKWDLSGNLQPCENCKQCNSSEDPKIL